MSPYRCPICRQTTRVSRDGIADHIERDHSPQVVIAELLNAVMPPKPAPTPAAGPTRTPCGKKPYPTKDAALHVLIRAALSKNEKRAEKRAYQCRGCAGSWHLTSKPDRYERTNV